MRNNESCCSGLNIALHTEKDSIFLLPNAKPPGMEVMFDVESRAGGRVIMPAVLSSMNG